MIKKQQYSSEQACSIGTQLKVDWTQIDLEQFRRGLEVELEHGAIDPQTNVTGDELVLTAKIAWAHLKEIRHTPGSDGGRSERKGVADGWIPPSPHQGLFTDRSTHRLMGFIS